MIVAIYVAIHSFWSVHDRDYRRRSEEVSFDAIRSHTVEKAEGNRIEIDGGDKPRYWIKTPALATIREAMAWDVLTMGRELKTKVNPYGYALSPCKTLHLAGETISGKVAWVVLAAARRGSPDYTFVEAPEVPTLPKPVENIPAPMQPPDDTDGPIRGIIHDKPIVEMTDAECDEEIAALEVAIAKSKASVKAEPSRLVGQLAFDWGS